MATASILPSRSAASLNALCAAIESPSPDARIFSRRRSKSDTLRPATEYTGTVALRVGVFRGLGAASIAGGVCGLSMGADSGLASKCACFVVVSPFFFVLRILRLAAASTARAMRSVSALASAMRLRSSRTFSTAASLDHGCSGWGGRTRGAMPFGGEPLRTGAPSGRLKLPYRSSLTCVTSWG